MKTKHFSADCHVGVNASSQWHAWWFSRGIDAACVSLLRGKGMPFPYKTNSNTPINRNLLWCCGIFSRNSISISHAAVLIHKIRHFDEGCRAASEKVVLRAVKFRRRAVFSELFRQFFPLIGLHNINYWNTKRIMATEFSLCIHEYIQPKISLYSEHKTRKRLQMHTFAHYAQSCAQGNSHIRSVFFVYQVYIIPFPNLPSFGQFPHSSVLLWLSSWWKIPCSFVRILHKNAPLIAAFAEKQNFFKKSEKNYWFYGTHPL